MALNLPEIGLGDTRNSCIACMPQESWVERTLVEAWVKLKIQVVLGVPIVVRDYEMPKQPLH